MLIGLQTPVLDNNDISIGSAAVLMPALSLLTGLQTLRLDIIGITAEGAVALVPVLSVGQIAG